MSDSLVGTTIPSGALTVPAGVPGANTGAANMGVTDGSFAGPGEIGEVLDVRFDNVLLSGDNEDIAFDSPLTAGCWRVYLYMLAGGLPANAALSFGFFFNWGNVFAPNAANGYIGGGAGMITQGSSITDINPIGVAGPCYINMTASDAANAASQGLTVNVGLIPDAGPQTVFLELIAERYR